MAAPGPSLWPLVATFRLGVPLVALVTTLAAASSGCGSLSGAVKGVEEAAEDTDVAIVWTGMEHAWDRKAHRAGKIGNWVELAAPATFPKAISLHHMAEAGSDADNASFSVDYDLVQATNTRFIPGTKTTRIQVSENTTPRISLHLTIPVSSDSHLPGKTRFAAVLNGFALKVNAASKALKLGTLELVASTPTLSLQNIEFDITGVLFMSCDSGECPWFKTNTQVDYTLDVQYLLIASTDDWFNPVQHHSISTSYDYDSGSEVPESLGSLDGVALSPPLSSGYGASVTAMRGFRFEVRKNTSVFLPDPVPHLYKWKMWGHLTGVFSSPDFTGQAFFAHSSNGPLNVGHVGHVTMRIDPLTLQFKVGLLKQCSWHETRAFGSVEEGGRVHYDRTGQIDAKGTFGCIP